MGTQFYNLQAEEAATTLPLVSVVADETSASVGPVTVRPSAEPAKPVVTPLSGETTASAEAALGAPVASPQPSPSLPIKVDKSSTAAQALQLIRFERHNQIGEAFLLASDLMQENPEERFAYDAAIRTSLILGLHDDVEKIHRQAIAKFPDDGSYYIQLAHLYQRAGKTAQLQDLIADFEKRKSKAPDAPITLARLFAIAGKEVADKPGEILPFPIIRQRAVSRAEAKETTRAVELLSSASQMDLSRWEARTLALELANLPTASAETILVVLQRALANEPQYEVGRTLVDGVLQLLAQHRKVDDLLHELTSRATAGKLSDPDAFIGARLTEMLRDMDGALYFIAPARSGSTPLVAHERARLYSNTGRTTDAIAILSNLLAEQPTDAALRIQLAQQHATMADVKSVLQTLAAINLAELEPAPRRDFIALTTSATVHTKSPQQVLKLWAEHGKKLPWSDLQLMGDILVQEQHGESFWNELTSAALSTLDRDRGAWPLYGLLARVSGTRGDFRSELEHYESLIKHDPENIPLLRFGAELATQHSSVAINLFPPNSTGGEITIHGSDSGGTSFAMQLYRRLIELQPRVSENYSALMRAYQLNGEIESAKRVAVDLADRGSSTTEACLSAAGILEENGLTTDSLVFYRAAVLASQDNFVAWMRYASALRMTGKYREAEIIYKRILESGYYGVAWNQPAIFANLLAMAHDTERVTELVQYLDSLRAKDIPDKAEFYLSSAKLMMQVKETELAATFLREFRLAFPESRLVPDALLLLGQLQYSSNDLEAARGTFMQVADEFSTSPATVVAMFNAGEILRQTQKAKEAIDLWQQLAKRFPEDDKALSALFEASLTAWTELRDAKLASDLMTQFVSSGSLDQELLKQASASLKRMAEGKPPIVE